MRSVRETRWRMSSETQDKREEKERTREEKVQKHDGGPSSGNKLGPDRTRLSGSRS